MAASTLPAVSIHDILDQFRQEAQSNRELGDQFERLMDHYQVTTDKASGIPNNPNDWCREHDNPRYIIDLIKRVVRVSLETNKIVQTLPSLNERKVA